VRFGSGFEIPFDVLESATLGFGHHHFHPYELEDHHEAEEEEHVSGGEGRHHRREKQGEEGGENPVGEAAERLALRPVTVRENLRDQDPDDRSLSDRVRCNERKHARGNDGKRFGEERPRTKAERGDVAKRADVKQGAATEAVDQPEADESKDQVGDPDADRLEQCRFLPQTGELENARCEIQDRIDARELVEESEQEGKQDRRFQPHAPEPSGARLIVGHRSDFIHLRLDHGLRGIRVDEADDTCSGGAVILATDQPARALGNDEAGERVDDRRNRHNPQHPPPRVFSDAGQQVIREKRNENTEDDVELEHSGELSAAFRRRDFRDVKR